MGGVQIRFGLDDSGYSAGVERVRRQTKQLKDEMKGLGDVSPMQAASGAIRLMEGDITRNVRAVEKFISTIPGVSRALQYAFPTVGALAFAGVVYRVGEEAAQAIQKVIKAPQAISNSFREMGLSAESSVDTLRLSTAQMNEQIALLTGKRPNELAIELGEASVAADKLASSLSSAQQKMAELMKANGLSGFAAILGRSGTAEVSGSVNSFNQQIGDLAAQYQHAVRTSSPDASNLLKQLNDKQNAALNYANQQIAARSGPQPAGSLNQDANLSILRGYRNTLIDQQDDQQAENENQQVAARQKALEASRKYAEELKKIQEQIVTQWRQALDQDKALSVVGTDQEAEYWLYRAATVQKGSLSYITAMDEANKAIARINAESMALMKSTGKKQQGFDDTASDLHIDRFDLSRDDTGEMKNQGNEATEYLRNLNEGIRLQQANANAIAQASIQMDEMTGRISRLDAAQALAALHTKEYKDATSALADAMAQAQSLPPGFERDQRITGLQNQGIQMAGQRQIQITQDQQSVSGNTVGGAVQTSLSQMVTGFMDMAQTLKTVIPQTINGLNDDIVKAMTGQGKKGDFGRTLLGAGQGLLKAGLQQGEGGLLSFLSHGKLGPKRDGSSAETALYVIQAQAAASISGMQTSSPGVSAMLQMKDLIPGGSFIQPFLKSAADFLPHFAQGGPVAAGQAIWTGENGPEPFIPKTAGTIIPNHALGGGDVHHHYHVDARGSNDPAAIQAAVRRGVSESVVASMHAQHQSRMRTPHGR